MKTYLRPELYDHPERGCPLAALAPDLARVDKQMKPQIVAQLVNYKSRMVPFMPGRRTVDKDRAFFAIFSTMIGAIEIALHAARSHDTRQGASNSKRFSLAQLLTVPSHWRVTGNPQVIRLKAPGTGLRGWVLEEPSPAAGSK